MEPKSNIPHINMDDFEDLTHDVPEEEEQKTEPIGDIIKQLRKERDISLQQLSQMTGFDVELLEGIENQEIQPQLGTVIKLSRVLDSAFSRLVSGVGTDLYSITRRDERKSIHRCTTGKDKKHLYTYKSLAPEVRGRHMESLVVQLEDTAADDLSVHEGEEFIFVLEGTVSLKLGDEQHLLEPGDSAYYLSTISHQISGKDGRATILAVIYDS